MKKLLFILLLTLQSIIHTQENHVTLFCHGIVDDKSQADRYEGFTPTAPQSFNFPDAEIPEGYNLNNLIFQICNLFGKRVNRDAMHMGYGPDITTLDKEYNQIDSSKKVVLYGLSRGGATAINYVAQHNPKNLAALVIESAPADVVEVVDEIQHKIGFKFAPTRQNQEAVFQTIFPACPASSTPPIADIANIKDKNLPILIIHSKEDRRVNILSSQRLNDCFRQNGFTNVYLCELNHGKHGFCTQGDSNKEFLQTVHSFYKKHGLPYNSTHATVNIENLKYGCFNSGRYYKELNLQYELMKKVNQAAIAVTITALITFFIRK